MPIGLWRSGETVAGTSGLVIGGSSEPSGARFKRIRTCRDRSTVHNCSATCVHRTIKKRVSLADSSRRSILTPEKTGSYQVARPSFPATFVSKLDASGGFVWAKSMGRPAGDHGLSIALDELALRPLKRVSRLSTFIDLRISFPSLAREHRAPISGVRRRRHPCHLQG